MPELFATLVEYQNFGLNTTTITAAAIICISVFQAWGMGNQVREIWKHRSGDGLAVPWLSYSTWFFVAALVYALHTRSGAMLINASVMMTGHLIILIGTWRFKDWTRNEKWQTTIYAMVPVTVAISPSWQVTSLGMPGKDAAFLACSFFNIYAVATQPWEMWRKKTAGIVDPRLVGVHLLAVAFWSVYAFHIEALALQILNPALFVLFSLTIVLWFLYHTRDPGTA